MFDLTELSYSTADEWFYPMAANNTSPTNSTNTAGHHTQGQRNTGPFIPPMPSAYGSSFSPPTSQSYPPLRIPPSSESRSNRPAPYLVPITVYHNPRSQSDRLASPPPRSRDHHRLHAPPESTFVGHLKLPRTGTCLAIGNEMMLRVNTVMTRTREHRVKFL